MIGILGTLHQGHSRFGELGGMQCTAIAYTALILAFLSHIPVSNWDTFVVDTVVTEGHEVYCSVLRQITSNEPHYLLHNELPRQLVFESDEVEAHFYDDLFFGLLTSFERNDNDFGYTQFSEALHRSFQVSDYILLTVEESTTALFHANDYYYVFDSHNQRGEVCQNGAAVLLRFTTLDAVYSYILEDNPGNHYEMTPVVLEKKRKHKKTVEHQKPQSRNLPSTSKCSKRKRDSDNSVPDIILLNDPIVPSYPDAEVGSYIDVDSENIDQIYFLKAKTPQKKKKSVPFNVEHSEIPYNDHAYSMKASSLLSKQKKIDTYEKDFIDSIMEMPNEMCSCCHKFLFPSDICDLDVENSNVPYLSVGSILCRLCKSSIEKNKMPYFCAVGNNLNVCAQPSELKELSIVDKRFVCKIHTFMTLLVLPRGGQFAQSGMAIHFEAPIQEIINDFPYINSENFIQVVNEHNQEKIMYMNMDRVVRALSWLKENNHLYSNIKINFEQDIAFNSDTDLMEANITEYGSVPTDYVVPDAHISTYLQNGKIVLPHLSEQPVNLDKMLHGEEMAFPHLFPDGKNGLMADRPIKLTHKKYFQHRLYHKDSRWRTDVSYLLNAINMCERQQLMESVNVAMKWRNGQSINVKNDDLGTDEYAITSENSYMFAKHIRGTAAYWKDRLNDLLAMIKCLGPPTIFFTLSANDNHWPELAMMYTGLSFDELPTVDLNQHVKRDPLLAAIHFERRWEALLKYLKNSQLFGEILDYFARIEFQCRGSAHLHGFLWLKDVPDFKTSSHKAITKFIDSVISTELPDEKADKELFELVTSLQVHHHTFSCQRNRGNICRFGFPRKAVTATKILNNIDLESGKGQFYETKRGKNAANINAYNPKLLKLWKANLDIQIVGSSKGAAYYVCSYLCKAEPEDLKNAMQNLIQEMSTENLTLRTRLLKIGFCLLKNRKLSAQEAVYRLSKLNLVKCSRHVLRLSVFPPQKGYKILKPKVERDNLPTDSEDLFLPNIIDYYHHRPNCLETWSLFSFSSWFSVIHQGYSSSSCEYHLNSPFQKKFIRQRKHPFVIRTPNIKYDTDDYYYSLLLLHLPHREEKELLEIDGRKISSKCAFDLKHTLFDTDRVPYEWFSNDIESQVRRIRLSQDDLAEHLSLSTHETNEQTVEATGDFCIFQPSVQSEVNDFSDDNYNSIEHEASDAHFHSLMTTSLTEQEIAENIAKMTTDQKKVFTFIKKHYLSKVQRKPLRVFITGGAGVGKTFLTTTICDWIRNTMFTMPGTNPVIICAPTGVAAHNVNGHTLHSTLSLAVQHGYEPTYEEVSPKTLKKLRQRFNCVHTIVIDEISMVSSNMLLQISKRLSSIKDNNMSFGGLNVILIGDFFQLRPVRGHFAFRSPLWHEFTPFFLDQNVRQSGDTQYAALLDRVRLGDLSDTDISILKARIIPQDQIPDEIMHMYPKLKQVSSLNALKLQKLQLTNSIISIPAQHFYSDYDAHAGESVTTAHIPLDDRNAGGLPKTLHISKKSRVMLLRNIMTENGLVNGANGYVEDIVYAEGKIIEILVKFDNPSIGRILQREDSNNAIPIQQYSQNFCYKGRSITRIQFPLNLSWACSIHKVQGLISLSSGVISLGNDLFAKGQGYVALSRIRSLQGLYLESLCPSKIKACPSVIEEYRRLRELLHQNCDAS